MLRFVIRKMISKKWMVLALLIGNILLVSITASNPMYTRAVLQRTLLTDLSDYMAEKNRYPLVMTLKANASASRNQYVLDNDVYVDEIPGEFGVPAKNVVKRYSVNGDTESNLDRNDRKHTTITVAMLSEMNDHISMVAGTGMSTGADADGIYDVILSEKGIAETKLLLGEILTFNKLVNKDGEPLKVRIAGVFKNRDVSDTYWVQSPNSYSTTVFIDEGVFRDWFMQEGYADTGVEGLWIVMMDYKQLQVENVDHMIELATEFPDRYPKSSNMTVSNNFINNLTEFTKTEAKVRTTILVLQVPIFVLLAAFIFMVSKQMLDMEQAEIAVLKSRGAGRAQVITIYVIQSLIMAVMSLAIGIPVAVLLVQVLGAANAFLEFVKRSALNPVVTVETLIYAGTAAFISMCAMVLPVFKHSKVTIVNQKQRKHRKSDAPIWQKLFLDVILLGVSIYGLYSFNNQKEFLAQRVLEGASLDPILFLSSSLFMLGAGMFALRVLPVIVWAIFSLFKKQWSPALYTSFLRVLRTRNQQGFIMVFLIMTIALGVFDASAARTINNNDERNLRYMTGADISMQEHWDDNSSVVAEDPTVELVFREPDFGKYTQLDGVESLTRVLVEKNGSLSVKGGTLKNVMIMGINTKEFGQTAWFEDGLLQSHWYNYLNAMSQKAKAVLVSSNFAKNYGYKIGDAIYYKAGDKTSVRGVIYGFVDYWPGYAPTTYSKGTNGLYSETENYLIVANLSQLQATWGVTPYQVWMKVDDSSAFIYDYLNESQTVLTSFHDISSEIVSLKNDPVIQGTNGILTVGFIVVLVLCCVGFLIYWILSIKSRELQFGIFRAMGMSMREIITMLINEHIFISGAAIATGAFVGRLTADLFMPLIQIAYSSSDNALPLRVINDAGDNIRLAVIIGLMIGVCLVVLAVIIRKMKIAQALKLGED